MGTSKQDRQGARSVADLERKYNFESFADAYNIATDARNTAEEAKKTAEDAKENPNVDHKAVFNALTADGTLEGLYRKDGSLYINASYIKSGTYVGETELFLEPGQAELNLMNSLVYGTIPTEEQIAMFDFNGNGEIDEDDIGMATDAMNGVTSLEGVWLGAKKSKVKIEIDVRNPEKTLSFTATNVWGRVLDYSIGINNSIFIDNGSGNLYRYYEGEKEWLNPPIGGTPLAIGMETDGTAYRTIERDRGVPIYKRVNADPEDGNFGVSEYAFDANPPEWYPLYPVDGIVEQGETQGWTYRKWHSGLAECWGKMVRTGLNCSKNKDIGHYYSDIQQGYLPLQFKTVTDFDVHGGSNGGDLSVARGFTCVAPTSTFTWVVISPASTATSVNITAYARIVGTWK